MNKKQVIKINENQLRQIVAESVKRVLKETDFHKGFKRGKRLEMDKLGLSPSIKDTFTDDEIFDCLSTLKEKLKQAEERASTGLYDEGEAKNYLVGAIRGLQSFIDSH